MYHHRYQPQTSNIANKNPSANASDNFPQGSSKISASVVSSYQSGNQSQNQVQPPSNVVVTSIPAQKASSDSAASANSFGNGNNSFNDNYRLNYHSSPYSSLSKQFVEERQDVIFRKVRGILNKITPETFDKLTNELVNVGLDSPRTLRGVIYLLFDKALKDLKYSSLYAKLCQELSEKSPNFEQEPGPNTFCKFLISKCEDEFERRRKANEDFDGKNELTDEEFEQKIIAKQKMLGNIKFICELGKKRLLQEEILHECIRGLLSKKKREKPTQDQAQDLECLCQIMRTIGSLLDIDASKNLMDQYFERIDMFSKKPELPSRIRFMLRDVIDLRNNKWRPRPFQREDNVPQPLSKLREELGYGSSSPSISSVDKLGNKNLVYINDLSKLSSGKLNSLLLDDEPSFTTSTDFHWGSPLIPDRVYDMFSAADQPPKTVAATNASCNLSSITKHPQSTNVKNLANMSSYSFSTSHPGSDIFNDYKPTNINNRIDPFSDSFRAKSNLSNNNAASVNPNNISDRRTTTENNSTSGTHKREDRFYQSHQNNKGSVREAVLYRHGMRQNLGRKDEAAKFDRISTQLRTNVANLGPNHDVSKYPPNRRDQMLNRRSAYEDSPRPPPMSHIRPDNSLPNARPMQPNANDMIPPPPPPLPPNQTYKATQDISNHQPHNQCGDMFAPGQVIIQANDRLNHRDRIIIRNNEDRHDTRQQAFFGANYKHPGRERHQQPPHAVREKIPESELNQNWRANRTTSPPRISEVSRNSVGSGHLQPKIQERNFDTNSEQQRKSERNISDDSVVTSLEVGPSIKTNGPLQHAVANTSHDRLESQPFVNQQQSKSPVGTRLDRERTPVRKPIDDRSIDRTNQTLTNRPRPRENHDHKPALHPPSFQTRRYNNQDSKDKRDTPRRQTGPPLEFDGRVFQRPYINETNNNEKKNFKPTMARNLSFEAPKANDSKKGPVWRRDGFANNSNPSISKETTTSAITNSFLSKAPSKLSDSDFSLRPSHNLSSRVISAETSVTTKFGPASDVVMSKNPVSNQPVQVNHERDKVLAKVTTPVPQPEFKVKSNVPDTDNRTTSTSASSNKSESISTQFSKVFSDFRTHQDVTKSVARIKELKIQKQHQAECLVIALKESISKSDKDRGDVCKILTQLIPGTLDVSALTTAFLEIFEQLQGMEVEAPKVKSIVATLLSQTTTDGLISIGDVASLLSGGKHHPLFLLYLQKLEKMKGKAWLNGKFTESKVSLMDMLPEVDRTKERLAIALKDRCLGFLDPMLTIEPDLWEQMRDRDATATAIYRWIKENVDPSIQSTTTFAHVFVRCLLRYVHNSSIERVRDMESAKNNDEVGVNGSQSSSKSSPTNAVVQALSDHEKELMVKYQHILQAILKDKEMQLASLYALQAFYHGLDFPKGSLLRWFHLLYDMSIVDDDVYFTWKEEINDEYPGKGQALFQVNTWLQWLAEAESEDEEDE